MWRGMWRPVEQHTCVSQLGIAKQVATGRGNWTAGGSFIRQGSRSNTELAAALPTRETVMSGGDSTSPYCHGLTTMPRRPPRASSPCCHGSILAPPRRASSLCCRGSTTRPRTPRHASSPCCRGSKSTPAPWRPPRASTRTGPSRPGARPSREQRARRGLGQLLQRGDIPAVTARAERARSASFIVVVGGYQCEGYEDGLYGLNGVLGAS